MKKSKYINTFQIHEQLWSFQGIDACDVIDVGNFSFSSMLLAEYELCTITDKSDINLLLEKLYREIVSTTYTVSVRRERATELYPYPFSSNHTTTDHHTTL